MRTGSAKACREVKIVTDGGLAESVRASVRKAEQADSLKGTSDTRMQFYIFFFLEGLVRVLLACRMSSLSAQFCRDPLLSPTVQGLHGVSVAGMSVKDKAALERDVAEGLSQQNQLISNSKQAEFLQ